MLRVLHVIGQLEKGGAESRIIDLLECIHKSEIIFDFIVTKSGTHYFTDKVIELGCKVIYLSPPLSSGYFVFIKDFIAIIRKNKYSIVHAHTGLNEGIIMFASFLANVKTRIAHSRSASDLKSGFSWTIYRFFMRILINIFATHKIACGIEASDYLFGKNSVKNGNAVIFS
jgi:hypothetical protein